MLDPRLSGRGQETQKIKNTKKAVFQLNTALKYNHVAWFYVLTGPGSQTTYSNEGHNANSTHQAN